MKKLTALILLFALCLSLFSCGGECKKCAENEKYAPLIGYIESKDYEKAKNELSALIGETIADTDTEAEADTENPDSSEEESTAQPLTPEEPEEDMLAERYECAVEHLSLYDTDCNYMSISTDRGFLHGYDAAAYLYNEFKELGDYKDSAEYLDNFVVYPNMLTKYQETTTDNLGNKKQSIVGLYNYTADGQRYTSKQLLSFLGLERLGVMCYYCDSGKILNFKWFDNWELVSIITPTYDDNGNIISAELKFASTDQTRTNTYTYDESNRLIEANLSYDYKYRAPDVIYYTYDENGNLTEKKCHGNSDIYRYSYDENGDLIREEYVNVSSYSSIEETVESYEYEYEYDESGYLVKRTVTHYYEYSDGAPVKKKVGVYEYTNDENGNPLSATLSEVITNLETGIETREYASQELTYWYETLYFYISD